MTAEPWAAIFDTAPGRVTLRFSAPLRAIGLTPDGARRLAAKLLLLAESADDMGLRGRRRRRRQRRQSKAGPGAELFGPQALNAERAESLYAEARQAVEADAEQSVAHYLEERRVSPTCPSGEQWRREAFDGLWEDSDDYGGVPRELAERWFAGAWELELGRRTNAPVQAAGVVSLAERARARNSDPEPEPERAS
ncbi:MAG TPA: hypothetical protein VF989_15345 [Polyangiaceae bacterium]